MKSKRLSRQNKKIAALRDVTNVGHVVVKANQGENPVHEPFYPKKDITDLNFFRYPNLTAQALRNKLSRYTGFHPEQIYCTNGSDEALMLLIRLVVAPGEEIIVCPPTFFKYDFYATFARVSAKTIVRNPDFSLNLSAIKSAISKKTKMIIIDSPGNPCGTTVSKKEIQALLAHKDIMVVIDECYFEYCGETAADLIRSYPNLVICRTFSKWAGLAGLRVGYVIASESVINGLNGIRFPCYINTVGQYFASYALDHIHAFLRRLRRLNALRDKAIRMLRRYPGIVVYPSKTAFILIKLQQVGSAQELQKYMEQHGILIYVINQPLNLPLLENSIRINFETAKGIQYFCRYFEKWLALQKSLTPIA